MSWRDTCDTLLVLVVLAFIFVIFPLWACYGVWIFLTPVTFWEKLAVFVLCAVIVYPTVVAVCYLVAELVFGD